MTLLARTCSILMHCSGNINRGTKRNEGSEKRKFLSFPLCYFFFSILHMLVVYLYRIFISWFITNKICLFSVFLLLFSLQFAFLFSFFVPCTLFLSHYLCRATNRLHYVSFGTVSLLYRKLLSLPYRDPLLLRKGGVRGEESAHRCLNSWSAFPYPLNLSLYIFDPNWKSEFSKSNSLPLVQWQAMWCFL